MLLFTAMGMRPRRCAPDLPSLPFTATVCRRGFGPLLRSFSFSGCGWMKKNLDGDGCCLVVGVGPSRRLYDCKFVRLHEECNNVNKDYRSTSPWRRLGLRRSMSKTEICSSLGREQDEADNSVHVDVQDQKSLDTNRSNCTEETRIITTHWDSGSYFLGRQKREPANNRSNNRICIVVTTRTMPKGILYKNI